MHGLQEIEEGKLNDIHHQISYKLETEKNI